MNEIKIREMLSDIIAEVDYDIWKECFNPDTIELDKLNRNYKYLIKIVEHYLGESK